MSNDYAENKQLMLYALRRAVAAHESGLFSNIENDFDDMDGRLPREAGPEFDKLLVALRFWDCWIDASNHDWQYYKGMTKDDWPRTARRVITDLEAEREISDEAILRLA